MRTLLTIVLLMTLAACSGDPRSYGITGPGTQPMPPAPSVDTPDTSTAPGMSTTGTNYGPGTRPTTGASGFWGYN
jgi:hypothetical protein